MESEGKECVPWRQFLCFHFWGQTAPSSSFNLNDVERKFNLDVTFFLVLEKRMSKENQSDLFLLYFGLNFMSTRWKANWVLQLFAFPSFHVKREREWGKMFERDMEDEEKYCQESTCFDISVCLATQRKEKRTVPMEEKRIGTVDSRKQFTLYVERLLECMFIKLGYVLCYVKKLFTLCRTLNTVLDYDDSTVYRVCRARR